MGQDGAVLEVMWQDVAGTEPEEDRVCRGFGHVVQDTRSEDEEDEELEAQARRLVNSQSHTYIIHLMGSTGMA